MDGGGGVSSVAAPACLCVPHVDGVLVPIPGDVGLLLERTGGFIYPAHEGHRAAAKAARQMDHYRRVRRNAKRMPEVASKFIGGEDTLVELMYGDVDESASCFLEGRRAPRP